MRRIAFIAFLAGLLFVIGRAVGWCWQRSGIVGLQRELIESIDDLNGHYYYDFQLGPDGNSLLDPDDPKAQKSWLCRWTSNDWWHDIFYVSFAQFDSYEQEGGVATNRHDITTENIESLAELPHLKWLALNGTGVTDQSLSKLLQSGKLSRLWLSQSNVTDQGLLNVGRCRELDTLAIEATQASDKSLRAIVQLPNLRSLSLGSPGITAEGMRLLGYARNLEELFADRLPINLSITTELGKLSKLRSLSLRFTNLSDDSLVPLQSCQQLEVLRLDGTSLTNKGLETLGKLTQLNELDLNGSNISNVGLKSLKSCNQLKHLNIANTGCTLTGAVELFHELLGLSIADTLRRVCTTESDSYGNLVSVDFSNIRLAVEDLVQLQGLEHLQWLDLHNLSMDDMAAKVIVSLGLDELTLLQVDGRNLTHDGLAALVSLPKLRDLHLGVTSVAPQVIEDAMRSRSYLRIYYLAKE
ncbi:MAG: hypothetical protein KDB03_16950 [Planctomycetales bacterium]|nr:hypothetical protein [Planctomycetales bacterium]